MLVFGTNLVLSAEEDALPANTPLIGWQNLVTFSNVSSDTADADYPITNIANPATNIEWRAADTTAQEIFLALNTVEDVDYVGIARHNFGSPDAAIAVEIGYYDNSSPPVFTTLAGPVMPGDNRPLMFWFTPQAIDTLVIKLASGSAAARIGVVYAGKLLVMERGVGVDADFGVPTYGRKTSHISPSSAAGDYLGRVVLGQWVEWAASFSHLTPAWYRTYFDPFVAAAADDTPFFYAWSPDNYPYETTFNWLVEDPQPMTSPVTGRVAVSIQCRGINT